jgi:hypothetical protein
MTDATFKQASWDWIQDTITATAKWGDIGDWNVSDVEDFSYAFSSDRDVIVVGPGECWQSATWNYPGCSGYVEEGWTCRANGAGNSLVYCSMIDPKRNPTQCGKFIPNADTVDPVTGKCTGTTGPTTQTGGRGNPKAASFAGTALSKWTTTSLTSLASTFSGAGEFNADLSAWKVAKVTTLYLTFFNAAMFVGTGLGRWNVAKITTLSGTFAGASKFTGAELGSWDTASVTTLLHSFNNAKSMNADFSTWDVTKVNNLVATFANTPGAPPKFVGEGLAQWKLDKIKNAESMIAAFEGANGLSSCNKRKIADAWPINIYYNAWVAEKCPVVPTIPCVAGSNFSSTGNVPCQPCATCGSTEYFSAACTTTTNSACGDKATCCAATAAAVVGFEAGDATTIGAMGTCPACTGNNFSASSLDDTTCCQAHKVCGPLEYMSAAGTTQTNSVCAAKKSDGTTCSQDDDAQCLSGACLTGRCCDKANGESTGCLACDEEGQCTKCSNGNNLENRTCVVVDAAAKAISDKAEAAAKAKADADRAAKANADTAAEDKAIADAVAAKAAKAKADKAAADAKAKADKDNKTTVNKTTDATSNLTADALSHSPGPDIRAIVGSISGIIVIIAMIALLIHRRRRSADKTSGGATVITPRASHEAEPTAANDEHCIEMSVNVVNPAHARNQSVELDWDDGDGASNAPDSSVVRQDRLHRLIRSGSRHISGEWLALIAPGLKQYAKVFEQERFTSTSDLVNCAEERIDALIDRFEGVKPAEKRKFRAVLLDLRTASTGRSVSSASASEQPIESKNATTGRVGGNKKHTNQSLALDGDDESRDVSSDKGASCIGGREITLELESDVPPPCPWSVADVTKQDSPVDDDDLVECILSYSASVRVFRDRYHLPNNKTTLLKRGRERLNEYYCEIERSYSPFLPAQEFERRLKECSEMERDCNRDTSHQLGVKVLGFIEMTLQLLCVRNAIRGKAKGNGMGGYAKSLIDKGRITEHLGDRVHEAARFRNVNIGHESVGSAQGVAIQPAKTREFLRLFRDLLNESRGAVSKAGVVPGLSVEALQVEGNMDSPPWQTKWDETAAWSVELFAFKPCGYDGDTKHIHAGLRGLEDKVRMGSDADDSWSDNDNDMAKHYLEEAVAYINTRKENTAQNVDLLMAVVSELRLGFTSIYNAVGDRIAKERGYADAIAFFANLQGALGSPGSMCQGRNHLIALYLDGANIKPLFDELIGKIAKASKGVFKESPLKHLFRAVEKTAMKLATDPNLGRADNVYDIVRCMVEYKTMAALAAGVRALEACKNVTVLRVKDRFSNPTPGGWMDVMVSVEIKGDRNKHVCEVQFVHTNLLLIRKGMGGHDEYAVYRSAVELLEVHLGPLQ